jgi:hypothetical protein
LEPYFSGSEGPLHSIMYAANDAHARLLTWSFVPTAKLSVIRCATKRNATLLNVFLIVIVNLGRDDRLVLRPLNVPHPTVVARGVRTMLASFTIACILRPLSSNVGFSVRRALRVENGFG